jgi:hypothetical protein
VIGTAALVLMQRLILRHMAAVRGAPSNGALDPERPRRPASAALVLAAEDPALAPSGSSVTRQALLRVATAHATAGLVFAMVAALLLLTFG